MRRRAVALLIATLTAGALVVGAASEVGASVKKAKTPLCAGSTKKAAIKAIKDAYDFFLNGTKHPESADKETRIQYLSDPHKSASLVASFEASAAKNAGQAATTSVAVHKVTCKGKKKADVQFELVLGGKEAPGIAPNPGGAILEGKVWKVTGETLCNLTALGDASVLESGPCADIVSGIPPSDAA
jgi:hypothetical protein